MIIKYLNKGIEFLEFEVGNVAGFISVLQESKNIEVNNDIYLYEGIELRTFGTDNNVTHQLLVFLSEK
jgi:hypothetical protein